MNYIVFDLGGTFTKYAVMNDQFEFLEKGLFSTNSLAGREKIIKSIINIVTKYKKYSLQGIAISSPGIINNKKGIVLYANERIQNYTGTKLAEEITQITELPCSVENDVNCFALAEINQSYHSFLMITIGSGIGGAIVIHDQVYHGVNFSAGEFGQMLINNTKWEDLASIKKLCEKSNLLGLSIKNGKELFSLYDEGNNIAKLLIEEFYQNLAIGLSNLSYIFNPEAIIIGGGITERATFIDELHLYLKNIANPNYFGSTKIILSKNNNDGGMIGALMHYLNQHKKTAHISRFL